jgi:hypothetical protein
MIMPSSNSVSLRESYLMLLGNNKQHAQDMMPMGEVRHGHFMGASPWFVGKLLGNNKIRHRNCKSMTRGCTEQSTWCNLAPESNSKPWEMRGMQRH